MLGLVLIIYLLLLLDYYQDAASISQPQMQTICTINLYSLNKRQTRKEKYKINQKRASKINVTEASEVLLVADSLEEGGEGTR